MIVRSFSTLFISFLFLIGFGKSEVRLGETGNEEKVNRHNIKTFGVKER